MAFDRILQTGNGRVEYRLEILGLPYQFVSSERLAGVTLLEADSSEYITRLNGLKMKGKSFGYSLNPLAAEIQGDSLSFEIVDLDERVTELLATNPRKQARLVRNLADADYFNCYVSSVDGWQTGSYAFVGQETVKITAIVASGSRFVLNRGALGSEPFSYFVEGEFAERAAISFTDTPITLQGRTVKLYAYGEEDDPLGFGRIIWRGVLSSDLQLTNGGIWSLQAASILSKLEQDVGGGGFGKDFYIRGVYHPTTLPLRITVQSGTLLAARYGPTMAINYSGFDESVKDFIENFNAQIRHTSSVNSFDMPFWMDQVPDGRIGLFFRAGIATGGNIKVDSGGVGAVTDDPYLVLPRVTNALREEPSISERGLPARNIIPEERFGVDYSLYEVQTLDEGGAYGELTRVSGRVPATGKLCAYLAEAPMPHAIAGYEYAGADGMDNPYPASRIYFDAPYLPTTITELRATQEGREGEGNIVAALSGTNPINSTQRYIDTRCYGFYTLRNRDTKFSFGMNLVNTGSVVDFVEKLVELSPQYGAQGLFPIISTQDVDIASMRRTLESVVQTPFVTERNYTYFGEGKRLSEIFSEECKLLGCFPAITNDGKITIKKLRDFGRNEPGMFQISASNIITRNGFPTWRRSSDAVINEAQLLTKYSPDEDNHQGEVFNAYYTDSIAVFGKKRKFKITPFSQDTSEVDPAEAGIILWKILGKWGKPRPEVSDIQVPLTALSATVGDGVYLRIAQLPNVYDGTRGMSQAGMIRSVNYSLDEGKATLGVVLSDPIFTGLTPGLLSLGSFLSGGTTYGMRVSGALFSDNDSSFFTNGDVIRIIDTKHWNPVLDRSGTISGVPYESGGEKYVNVDFGTALSPTELGYLSSSGAVVSFTSYANPAMTDVQRSYAFVSSASLYSYFGG